MKSYYSHQVGASSAWLVKVPTDRVKGGAAAVKVWCVPVKKWYQEGTAVCDPARIRQQIQLVLAQQVRPGGGGREAGYGGGERVGCVDGGGGVCQWDVL
jgi:hypothetical protein